MIGHFLDQPARPPFLCNPDRRRPAKDEDDAQSAFDGDNCVIKQSTKLITATDRMISITKLAFTLTSLTLLFILFMVPRATLRKVSSAALSAAWRIGSFGNLGQYMPRLGGPGGADEGRGSTRLKSQSAHDGGQGPKGRPCFLFGRICGRAHWDLRTVKSGSPVIVSIKKSQRRLKRYPMSRM